MMIMESLCIFDDVEPQQRMLTVERRSQEYVQCSGVSNAAQAAVQKDDGVSTMCPRPLQTIQTLLSLTRSKNFRGADARIGISVAQS